jgi:phosphoribosylanthranilate isomerase
MPVAAFQLRRASPIIVIDRKSLMFHVKICGITNPADALAAVQAGAGALGLNLYAQSPRGITPEAARRILSVLPATPLLKVGVFVNAPARDVLELFDQLRLDLIQLHGDEPPDYLPELGGRPLIRAFRLTAQRLPPILDYLAKCETLGAKPRAVLLDAHQPGQYGGTGQPADWTACAEYAGRPGLPPLVLAGGLTPGNVAQAIRAVRPAAVDTASGVEISPGRKDPDAVRAFVQAAQEAFAEF